MRLPNLTSSDDFSGDNDTLNRYIAYHYGCSLDDILAPVGERKVGQSVRHNGVYFQIKEARRVDDPNLPQGVWTHELKTADWDLVEKTALEALCLKSKDLQLGVWLMESSIHRQGFAGIAPAMIVIQSLCQSFWDDMYPEMIDDDIEYRTNPINWINEKLSVCLKLTPITSTLLDGREYNLNDWENACRYERLRQKNEGDVHWEGASSESFKQRLAATDKVFLQQLHNDIDDALQATHHLIDWFDQRCSDDSPSLHELITLLQKVQSIVHDELARRGILLASPNNAVDHDNNDGDNDQQGGGPGQPGDPSDPGGKGPINHRADAFVRLREAAEFLMQDDPHSPVPYMVYTACEWGEKSAPDLYQELFLQKGGQLNIFEMMGLAMEPPERN